MKTLETERLVLRSWQVTDLNDFYEYASVEGVGEMAGWPHHTDIEVSRGVLKQFINEDEVYALVHKGDNKVIGSLGIHKKTMDENYKVDVQREIGYVLSKAYWGKGITAEAVKEAIKYAFDDIGVDVLWCGHSNVNNQSSRVVEKCGFKFYSSHNYDAKLLNEIREGKCYIITKAAFTLKRK